MICIFTFGAPCLAESLDGERVPGSCICRVNVWDFPVLLASFLIKSLENLPELFFSSVMTQLQVLPVQL